MKIKFLVIFGIIASVGMPFVIESFAEKTNSQNIGQVKWFGLDVNSEILAYKIQVIDNDMNENADHIDKFKIRVWSGSDPVGIMISVYETEKNSGLFESPIYFSEDVSTGQRLRAYDGDTVTAAYGDLTLPSSHISDTLDVSAVLVIYYPMTDPLENKSSFIRIEDETFLRQSLQTGETISAPGTFVSLAIGSLGSILIVLFVVICAIKKRMKNSTKEKK